MLELQGLEKRYGDTIALDGLSFTVKEGQMFGFVGANGAGKTTAMRIVLGVLEPDAGKVLWHGSVADADSRRHFGYMPEERGLYPKMRVGEQLSYLARLHGFSKGDAERAAGRWMKRLGVYEAGRRQDRSTLFGQPAAGPARRVPRPRPGPPGPRRTVLRPRPGGRGYPERGSSGAGGCRGPGRILKPPARVGRAAVRGGCDSARRQAGKRGDGRGTALSPGTTSAAGERPER